MKRKTEHLIAIFIFISMAIVSVTFYCAYKIGYDDSDRNMKRQSIQVEDRLIYKDIKCKSDERHPSVLVCINKRN